MNARLVAREELDLRNSLWHILDTKIGEALTVALAPEAVKILKRRLKAREDGCPWVFPSKRADSGHVEEPKAVMQRVCERAGIKAFRFRDLRHDRASTMVSAGVGLQVVGRQLGHKTASTTMKYAHVDLSTVHAALEAAEGDGEAGGGEGAGEAAEGVSNDVAFEERAAVTKVHHQVGGVAGS